MPSFSIQLSGFGPFLCINTVTHNRYLPKYKKQFADAILAFCVKPSAGMDEFRDKSQTTPRHKTHVKLSGLK